MKLESAVQQLMESVSGLSRCSVSRRGRADREHEWRLLVSKQVLRQFSRFVHSLDLRRQELCGLVR